MASRIIERRKLVKASVGEMRDRISLERREMVSPNFGDPENTMAFTVIAEVWAKVSSITYQASGEKNYNNVNISRIPALKFMIRYRDDIDFSSVVVRWRDKLYAIDFIGDPEERKEYTYITSILRGADSEEANQ